MKKNLMSVLILALVFVNLLLTAIVMFTLVPQAKNANALIESVATALDLELSSGRAANLTSVPAKDQKVLTYETSLNVNLQPSEDGSKDHYAVVTYSLVIDGANEEAQTTEELIQERWPLITDYVRNEIRKYSAETVLQNEDQIRAAALERIKGLFNNDAVIDVLTDITVG